MILLKERADKDQQQHNAEMKELLRIIDHDRNLREFMGIKGQERVDDPQLVAWRQKKGELTIFIYLCLGLFDTLVKALLLKIKNI